MLNTVLIFLPTVSGPRLGVSQPGGTLSIVTHEGKLEVAKMSNSDAGVGIVNDYLLLCRLYTEPNMLASLVCTMMFCKILLFYICMIMIYMWTLHSYTVTR